MPDYVNTFLDAAAVGRTPSDPFITHFDTRDPTIEDLNYPIQKRWVNTVTETEWILANFFPVNGVIKAHWIPFIGGIEAVETLTGNTGGPVGFDNNHNINVLGDTTTVTIAGNPATNTLTVTALFTETTYVENTGTATPSAGILNVFGVAPVTTAGSGNTIDIGVDGTVALTYVEDSGTAQAAGNILNVVGGTGITTSGSGNTITISRTTPGIDIIGRQVFTSSGTYTPTTNMLFADIQVIGGGGGAGGSSGTQLTFGGAGGGGGYAQGLFTAATIGASQPVTIGAGGNGAVGSASGTNGGTSSVGALISATGGAGGTGGFNGFTIGLPGVGGVGSGGDFQTHGTPGTVGSIASTFATTGAGGSTFFGGGAVGIYVSGATPGSGNGNNATSYGGGGSGSISAANGAINRGGNGFQGIVIITEYIAV